MLSTADRIKALASRDHSQLIFGAKEHCYKSHRITKQELRTFEERLGVTLPHDYAQFLLEVG